MLRKTRADCSQCTHNSASFDSSQHRKRIRSLSSGNSSAKRFSGGLLLAICILTIIAACAVTYRRRSERLLLPVGLGKTNMKRSEMPAHVLAPKSELVSKVGKAASISLKLASMNIAGSVPSAEAPPSWDVMHSARAIRGEILNTDPDIIALQECPSRDGLSSAQWAESLFEDYHAMGSAPAHAANVVLLIRKTLAPKSKLVPLQGTFLPAVMIQLEIGPNNQSVCVASCHLEPFLRGSVGRQQQVEDLLEKASPVPLILTGDTNMRETEDDVMENQLHLLDAWKLAGSDLDTKYSWDTMDHRSNKGQDIRSSRTFGSFNKYYGDSTRQYQARYDRLYIHQGNKVEQKLEQSQSLFNVSVPNFQLIANKPMQGSKTHFLSDHFGIYIQIDLEWSDARA